MGVLGSGRYHRTKKNKKIVENSIALDIRKLKQTGKLKPGAHILPFLQSIIATSTI